MSVAKEQPDAVAQATNALDEAVKHWAAATGTDAGLAAAHTYIEARDAYASAVRAECAAKVTDAEPCDWHQDGMGLWQTDCGNAFEFNEDGPWMNGLKFCGYCGKKLVEVPYEPMPDDDEEAHP